MTHPFSIFSSCNNLLILKYILQRPLLVGTATVLYGESIRFCVRVCFVWFIVHTHVCTAETAMRECECVCVCISGTVVYQHLFLSCLVEISIHPLKLKDLDRTIAQMVEAVRRTPNPQNKALWRSVEKKTIIEIRIPFGVCLKAFWRLSTHEE